MRFACRLKSCANDPRHPQAPPAARQPGCADERDSEILISRIPPTDYLPHLFGPAGYTSLRQPEELPKRLPLLYEQLREQ